jgi:hypothetical protein
MPAPFELNGNRSWYPHGADGGSGDGRATSARAGRWRRGAVDNETNGRYVGRTVGAQSQRDGEDTKQRLLIAAGPVFAERGYERSTIAGRAPEQSGHRFTLGAVLREPGTPEHARTE